MFLCERKGNFVKKIVLLLIALYATTANADNFVWQFYDPTFYDETGGVGAGGVPAGYLTGVSDTTYEYNLNTKHLKLTWIEYISDGVGGEYALSPSEFNYDNVRLSDFDTLLTFNTSEGNKEILNAFKQQAIPEVNTIRNNLKNQLHLNDVSNQSLDIMTTEVIDSIFRGDDMSTDTIAYDLNRDLSVIKNTNDIANEINRATDAENILQSGLNNERTNRINADAFTLNSAKSYADIGDAFTLDASKSYTDERIEKLDKDLSAGIASALALSSVASNGVKEGKMAFSGGYGYYNGQSAGAIGIAIGLSNNWTVHAGAGMGGSNVSFRAGTSYEITLW